MLTILASSLPLITKLLLTAAIVVAASIATERAGPFIGALVVTLPVTTWPAYLFLTLDHDQAFVAASALAGLAMVAVNVVLMLVYVLLAQRFGLAPSLVGALVVWVLLGAAAQMVDWPFVSAVVLNVIAFSVGLWLVQPYSGASMSPVRGRWYDIPMRVLLVCTLMGTILLFSNWAGPTVSGFAAVFPASSVSAILILHPRIGGSATGAMVANGIRCHAGIGGAAVGIYLTIVSFGPVVALMLGLAIPVTWNLLIWAMALHRRR